MNVERVKYVKSVADGVLKTLEIIDPYCIIAGGMPRDIDNGKPVSDIDAFFYVAPHLTNTQVKAMLQKLQFKECEIKDGSNIPEVYKRNPLLMCVFNTVVDGVPVQIMRMSEPTFKSVVPTFPLSICQIWYKNGKISSTKTYKECKMRNVIVKTNHVYESKHPFIEKICNKYSDWTYLG